MAGDPAPAIGQRDAGSSSPRISIVVPIYNVERYLDACLRSLAQQSVGSLEIVMVDDGSTDGSADIAREWERRDPRFHLVSQANGGLGNARNTGVAAAHGEFLAFVDSDDLIPRHGYELLLDSLDETGSDFATGNVDRFSDHGGFPVRFLAAAFARRRKKTHLSDFRPLLADRMVTNKLWRRSFWDEHSLRFPEGVLHEDIGVALRGHLLARSVDIVAKPVYLWRIRTSGDRSITQRRTEIDSFRHRLAAVSYVRASLAELGPPHVLQWYDASVAREDFAYHLKVLDIADDDYRREVVETLREFVAETGPQPFESLPAIERLMWHLVGRGLVDQVVEVVEFSKRELKNTPPLHLGDHWYGDFPFRTDPGLSIPDEVYRLDAELVPTAVLDGMTWTRSGLRVEGYVYIDQVGAPERQSQRLRVSAVSTRDAKRRIPLVVRRVPRPDVTADTAGLADLDWSGFTAFLPYPLLRVMGRLGHDGWRIQATVGSQGVVRTAKRWDSSPLLAGRVAQKRLDDSRVMRAGLSSAGALTVDLEPWPPRLTSLDVVAGSLQLTVRAGSGPAAPRALHLWRRAGAAVQSYPLTGTGAELRASVPLSDLVGALDVADEQSHVEDADDGVTWSVAIAMDDGRTERVAVDEAAATQVWQLEGGREVAAYRTSYGNLSIVDRSIRPVIDQVQWTPQGELVVGGRFSGDAARHRAVLMSPARGEEHAVAVDFDGAAGRFSLRVTPAAMPGRVASLPLELGWWRLYLDVLDAGVAHRVQFATDQLLLRRLPMPCTVQGITFSLLQSGVSAAALVALGDLTEDERGAAHQHRLQTVTYPAARSTPVRDVVTYLSFQGREFSDSPRALYRELVARDLPLDHRWVVRQGRCQVTGPAAVVRDRSEQFYEALATSRFVISNDGLPSWFVPRRDQVVLQTWHGHPLSRSGLDEEGATNRVGRDGRVLRHQAENWTYLLSPSPFATPILADALTVNGQLLETGLPRTDVLFGPDVAATAARVRERLGLPEGKRVVLYLPGGGSSGGRGGRRSMLPPQLDLEALRGQLSEHHVLLVRKDPYATGTLPARSEGFVVDASDYPDATELLAATDILVTDHSPLMFDWMNTGRPIVYFVPDVDEERDLSRGFYLDLEAEGPGPFVHTTGELAEAIRSADDAAPTYQERYDAFRSTYCALDDGNASARVVDALFRS